jgi:hypothetical protein
MDTWTWTHGHGHMDMDTWTWTHGHGHMDMDTWTWTHGHGNGHMRHRFIYFLIQNQLLSILKIKVFSISFRYTISHQAKIDKCD